MQNPSPNPAASRIAEKIAFLDDEIKILLGRAGPEDCGHLFTAVAVLKSRKDELLLALPAAERELLEASASQGKAGNADSL